MLLPAGKLRCPAKGKLVISDAASSKSDLNYQVVGQRILAAIIDLTVIGVLFSVLSALFGGDGDSDFQISLSGEPFLFGIAVTFAYYWLLEGKTGATLGKRALGLVVVKANGSECDLSTAAIRTVLRVVDVLPLLYLLGLIVVAVTSKNQRVGDLAAGTLVVSKLPAASAASIPEPETAEALRDLARLHADSILTDDEYEDKRRRLVEKL